MTYTEAQKLAMKGKTIMLPDFIGYFKWNYGNKQLMFENKGFTCPAKDFEIQNRKDFYYII